MFVFGNPPYLGFRLQTSEQKMDMSLTFSCSIPKYKKLDYIAQWFYKGTSYIGDSVAKCAFVSTNSICQGEHVALLWQYILQRIEIQFAYTSFKWMNNAKNKANVICVIVGIGAKSNKPKFIYSENGIKQVNNISPLLSDDKTVIVEKHSASISGLMPIILGSLPADDNNLSLNAEEKEILLTKYPEIECLIKPFVGSQEFIKGLSRYCLWIADTDVEFASNYPELVKRFEGVKMMRLKSSKQTTVEKAKRPWAFSEIRFNSAPSIIIPAVSSGRRKYIPTGFVEENTVIYHSAFAIYNGDLFTFGLVNSFIHVLWARTVGGKLKSDYRYSAQLVYNTFPFPSISSSKKSEIEEAATEVLLARENYPEKTLADLYDPDKMPADLREAHENLDRIVESCYPGAPFANDEARLECLFKLYEKMTVNKK